MVESPMAGFSISPQQSGSKVMRWPYRHRPDAISTGVFRGLCVGQAGVPWFSEEVSCDSPGPEIIRFVPVNICSMAACFFILREQQLRHYSDRLTVKY